MKKVPNCPNCGNDELWVNGSIGLITLKCLFCSWGVAIDLPIAIGTLADRIAAAAAQTKPKVEVEAQITAPKRIQRQRTHRWRMPENTIYVGRPTAWGNPFKVGVHGDAAECVALYRRWVTDESEEALVWRNSLYDDPNFGLISPWYGMMLRWSGAFARLRGKDLACWCSDGEPCHADVLLELANVQTL